MATVAECAKRAFSYLLRNAVSCQFSVRKILLLSLWVCGRETRECGQGVDIRDDVHGLSTRSEGLGSARRARPPIHRPPRRAVARDTGLGLRQCPVTARQRPIATTPGTRIGLIGAVTRYGAHELAVAEPLTRARFSAASAWGLGTLSFTVTAADPPLDRRRGGHGVFDDLIIHPSTDKSA